MRVASRSGLQPSVVLALGGVAALHVITSLALWGHASERPAVVASVVPVWPPAMRIVAAAWALACAWAFVVLGWRALRRGG